MDTWSFENLVRTFVFLTNTSVFVWIVMLLYCVFKSIICSYSKKYIGVESSETDFFSVASVAAFFVGFGKIGLSFLDEYIVYTAITIAILAGIFFLVLSSFIFSKIKRYVKISDILEDFLPKEIVAKTGVLPSEKGQIEIIVNNELIIAEGENVSDSEINENDKLKIISFENDVFKVEKMTD